MAEAVGVASSSIGIPGFISVTGKGTAATILSVSNTLTAVIVVGAAIYFVAMQFWDSSPEPMTSELSEIPQSSDLKKDD